MAVMAIDELLEEAATAKRRRDEAASEFNALLKALRGLSEVGKLDESQRRTLGTLQRKTGVRRRRRARKASAR